jgi:pimeloyl-ACP methyl ester carboxylesterase
MSGPVPVTLASSTLPTLRGHAHGQGTCWVLLVHDVGEDLDAWGRLPETLALAGYRTIAIDLPGHGLSDGPFSLDLLPALVDILLDHATAQGATGCHLIAAGLAASAALASAGSGASPALVGLSPTLDERWREAVRVHTGPKLLLASSLNQADLESAQQFFQVCRGPTILSTLPVPETGCRLLASAWADHAIEQILLFLRRNA